jgi:hypothetical protein
MGTKIRTNIKDKIILFRCSDSLDSDSIVEELVRGEVLEDILLDKLDT